MQRHDLAHTQSLGHTDITLPQWMIQQFIGSSSSPSQQREEKGPFLLTGFHLQVHAFLTSLRLSSSLQPGGRTKQCPWNMYDVGKKWVGRWLRLFILDQQLIKVVLVIEQMVLDYIFCVVEQEIFICVNQSVVDLLKGKKVKCWPSLCTDFQIWYLCHHLSAFRSVC